MPHTHRHLKVAWIKGRETTIAQALGEHLHGEEKLFDFHYSQKQTLLPFCESLRNS